MQKGTLPVCSSKGCGRVIELHMVWDCCVKLGCALPVCGSCNSCEEHAKIERYMETLPPVGGGGGGP